MCPHIELLGLDSLCGLDMSILGRFGIMLLEILISSVLLLLVITIESEYVLIAMIFWEGNHRPCSRSVPV